MPDIICIHSFWINEMVGFCNSYIFVRIHCNKYHKAMAHVEYQGSLMWSSGDYTVLLKHPHHVCEETSFVRTDPLYKIYTRYQCG